MPDLLFEIGCEELPPSAVSELSGQLKDRVLDAFPKARLTPGEVIAYGTPRRLLVLVLDLPESQERRFDKVIGPPASVAFDRDGKLKQAGKAFLEKHALRRADLTTVETKKGAYLAAEVETPSRKAAEVLSEVLPELVRALNYPRTMRWLDDETAFVRPIRWLVALLGGRVVKFAYAGLKSGAESFGHRITGFGPHDLSVLFRDGSLNKERVKKFYRKEMGVIVDPDERRKKALSRASRLKLEGVPQVNTDYKTEYALAVTVNSVEYPRLVFGAFKTEYLSLPDEVLEAALLGYLRLFPVRTDKGRIMPYFIAVHNAGPRATKNVRAGLERVLAARLADASYFWEVDRKVAPDEMAARLGSVLFAEGLGTLADKTRRLVSLAADFADWSRFDAAERASLVRAAEICKADLASEMVREKEFAHLQGIMGSLYADSAGEPPEVSAAIREHYRPVTAEESLPSTKIGRALSVIDRADTLAGCFGAGMAPSASKDPFGLRRGAIGLCRILLEDEEGWFAGVELELLLSRAARGYDYSTRAEGEPWLNDLIGFVLGRLKQIFVDSGYPIDIINAVTEVRPLRPRDISGRLEALAEMRAEARRDYLDFAIAFKRPINILRQGRDRGLEWGEFDPLLIQQDEEAALYNIYSGNRESIANLLEKGNQKAALAKLAAMRPAVDSFFDKVLVMCDDPPLRSNRLSLMQKLAELFLSFADFTHLRGEEDYE